MARKRMIDPSIWTDEGMADLTPRQQLLYIGLFSNADDDGRLKGSPVALSLMLPTIYSPSDRGTLSEDLESVLSVMHQLVKYDIDGREYLAFRNYRQWQRIEKPTASILPPPPDDTPNPPRKLADASVDSDTTPRPFGERSANDPGEVAPNRREEKGKEGNNGADAPQPTPKTKRATAVSPNFTVSDRLMAWAQENGFTPEQVAVEVPQFIDFYTAKGEARKDWDASFRTWMRNARKWNRVGTSRQEPRGFDPLRKMPEDEHADYLRRLEQAKREQDAQLEQLWRAS